MSDKMINCKTCGAEIAANAKVCPKCGAKNKKPIYKKWWFYVLIVLILAGIFGRTPSSSSSSTVPSSSKAASVQTEAQTKPAAEATPKPTPEPITYTHYKVTELFDALKANAMKAQNTFKDQYVEIEGYLGTIDSSGKYIGIGAEENNYDYLFQEVQCYIKSDEQRNAILEMNSGDYIVLRGKIISVGEVLGYSLNIDSIG